MNSGKCILHDETNLINNYNNIYLVNEVYPPYRLGEAENHVECPADVLLKTGHDRCVLMLTSDVCGETLLIQKKIRNGIVDEADPDRNFHSLNLD